MCLGECKCYSIASAILLLRSVKILKNYAILVLMWQDVGKYFNINFIDEAYFHKWEW